MTIKKPFCRAFTLICAVVAICFCKQISAAEMKLQSKLLFSSPDPIVALAADKNQTVYAVIYGSGDILKISSNGTSQKIYSGLKSCSFGGFAALTVLPNGDLAAYDCVDEKSSVIKIDPAGNKTTLATLDKDFNLMSMTSDPSGNIYLGYWTSGQANLTVSSNPNHISAAEDITGIVAMIDAGGKLKPVFEGGIPIALSAPENNRPYAVVWGKKGPFSSKSRKYSYCAATTAFWAVLSEQVQIINILEAQKSIPAFKNLNSVCALAVQENGTAFAAGKTETGSCGIYYLQQGVDPEKVLFPEAGMDENITALAASSKSLYLANVKGNIFKAKLSTAR
ncbi:MAG: hypothetical protein ABIJ31_08960 [Pseudomonadota bacterium]